MARNTILCGLGLIGLGCVGYFGGDSKSLTAFIPAYFGIVLLLFGLAAMVESWRMHAMHGAVGVSLLGFLMGLVRGIQKLAASLSTDGEGIERATIFVLLMTAICGLHVVLSVQSFIAARKARKETEAAGSKNSPEKEDQ